MNRNDLKKIIMLALYQEKTGLGPHYFFRELDWVEEKFGPRAEVVLSAIESAGLAIVPMKATLEIVSAKDPGTGDPLLTIGEYCFQTKANSAEFASRLYHAMVEAGRIR